MVDDSMRTLVCQPKGAVSTIRVYTDQDALLTGEFEAWTLLTGKQIMCVERRLHKLLERHHLGGTYDQGALYAFEYGELCAVLRDQLGPSDRDRCMKLQEVRPVAHRTSWSRLKAASYISWRTAGVMGFVIYKILATVVFFGVVAVLLNVFKKNR